MLRSPHTRYNRLHVYYFDRLDLPPINDPDHIGTWIEDDNAILFFHTNKDELVRDICNRTKAKIIYQADLDYQDWESGIVIESFSTKSLTVRPVWEKEENNDFFQEITLDPSVIFGSGFHATTRLCLETLELILLESGLKIDSMIDLGTGTGLLAIAAAKLGVGRVTAVDNNPMACDVARRNVALNSCGSIVEVCQQNLLAELPETGQYDLVVANLYKGLLLNLFEKERFWRARTYLISGFIAGMEGDLLAALPEKDIQVLHRGNSEMWRLWLLKNSTARN